MDSEGSERILKEYEGFGRILKGSKGFCRTLDGFSKGAPRILKDSHVTKLLFSISGQSLSFP